MQIDRKRLTLDNTSAMRIGVAAPQSISLLH
jgi:hypothetical protein